MTLIHEVMDLGLNGLFPAWGIGGKEDEKTELMDVVVRLWVLVACLIRVLNLPEPFLKSNFNQGSVGENEVVSTEKPMDVPD